MTRETWPRRSAPLEPAGTALLVIDAQQGILHPGAASGRPWFHGSATEVAVPNIRRLLDAARAAGVEVIFTVIESLTRDGRDRSIDYKETGFHFPPGSVEAEICDAVRPLADEIVLPKTSSSLFNSTIFDYLRLSLAQHGPRYGDRHRFLDRPVCRPHHARRCRSRLSHDLCDRRLHGRHGRAPCDGTRRVQRLRPANDDSHYRRRTAGPSRGAGRSATNDQRRPPCHPACRHPTGNVAIAG